MKGISKELRTVSIEEIVPYERNPRKNDIAVDDVAESIRQCGYVQPIVVDEEMTVLAGHTRLKALKQIGWKECEVMIVTGLTAAQKKKYRLLDNKTSEKATWDYELLDWELEEIDFEGYDFGFMQEDVDVDDFFDRGVETKQKEIVLGVKVICNTEQEMQELKKALQDLGYEPKEL